MFHRKNSLKVSSDSHLHAWVTTLFCEFHSAKHPSWDGSVAEPLKNLSRTGEVEQIFSHWFSTLDVLVPGDQFRPQLSRKLALKYRSLADEILSQTALEQFQFVASGLLGTPELAQTGPVRSRGTMILNTPILVVQFADDTRAYLVTGGKRAPIRMIFFPSFGLIVSETSGEFIRETVRKIFFRAVSNWRGFAEMWEQDRSANVSEKLPLLALWDDRPAHVFNEDLRGLFHLEGDISSRRLAIHPRADFAGLHLDTRPGAPTKGSFPLEPSSFTPLKIIRFAHDASQETPEIAYRNRVLSLAVESHPDPLPKHLVGRPLVWLGITGGEKRFWLEEVQGLVLVIQWARAHLGSNCCFVFDGWTSRARPSGRDLEMESIHRKLLRSIIFHARLSSLDFWSIIGTQGLLKIAVASRSVFFVSSGTPSMWPSLYAGRPGLIHGTEDAMKRSHQVSEKSNTTFVCGTAQIPPTAPLRLAPAEKKSRFDFESYSIDPHRITEALSQSVWSWIDPQLPNPAQ